jgi:hypothetical protein
MARIKIKDLPKDMKVTKEETKRIRGGLLTTSFMITSLADSRPTPLTGECQDSKHKDWIEVS